MNVDNGGCGHIKLMILALKIVYLLLELIQNFVVIVVIIININVNCCKIKKILVVMIVVIRIFYCIRQRHK